MLVFFGNASGPVPPIDPLLLTQKGSLFMTRPKLGDYTQTRKELLKRSSDVFNWVLKKKITVNIHKIFDLENAKFAHKEIPKNPIHKH